MTQLFVFGLDLLFGRIPLIYSAHFVTEANTKRILGTALIAAILVNINCADQSDFDYDRSNFVVLIFCRTTLLSINVAR